MSNSDPDLNNEQHIANMLIRSTKLTIYGMIYLFALTIRTTCIVFVLIKSINDWLTDTNIICFAGTFLMGPNIRKVWWRRLTE